MKATVFYSWQSDTPNAANRSLILRALEDAAKDIAGDASINIEPVVDRDTQNVAGSPDIGRTILDKIEKADVVVADVTIINTGADGRLTPNPNVLVEVGYALAVHTESRLILVENLAFGSPEQLPFDLRQKRVLKYSSDADATERASERRKLQSMLRDAITAVISQHGVISRSEYPVELSMGYRAETQTGSLHEYILEVALRNTGTKRIAEWHIDVEVPTPLLREVVAITKIRDRSDNRRSLFRVTQEGFGPIYPGDVKQIRVSYQMNQPLFDREEELFLQLITARAYAENALVAEVSKPVQVKMQCY